ncbi:response regulator [Paenirhodobacter enshiensis]|uniref:Chemotaxis protein CheY n=1 Tax=Paenirhodobacter enshiensis TaxID=1105367 RepID=A0A086XYV2_9RHOB|nr:response regulator [Paenirhodobacter enshiensis]KFI27202.1 chemotaxis protein CheY [Paenirhodobacter enshiensis]
MSIKDQLKILVVDDMSTSRGLVSQALEAIGIGKVGYADDGNSALKHMQSDPAHLVISDFNMPGMNGLELLRALRTNAATRSVGFILITGKATQDLIDTGRSLGMNNFLKKPFTQQEFRACLEAVVGRL